MANVNNLHVAVSATMGTPRTDEDITRTFTPLINRNTPSFVFRLPTETLQAIFIHGAYDHYSKDNGFPIRTPPSWVNVSYVCRHWRYVALNCPILWTFLFSVSPRWMEELLSRSKQAPLKLKLHSYVRISDKTPSLLSFLEKVVDHAERIQEICLCLDRQRQGYQFFAKLFSHAPLLQNVKVLFLPPFPSDNWPPSISLDGDTPALRTLEVSNFPIPWYSLMLSGVTTLSLSYLPGLSPQNMEQFLATLSRMKDLKHLYLDDALPSATGFLSSTAFRTFQSIDLPHLPSLSIAAPLSTVFALLSCMNVLLKTQIKLQYNSERGSFPHDYTLLSPVFAQRFGTSEDQALSTPIIRSMLIEFEDYESGAPMLSVSLSECDRHPFFSSMDESRLLHIVADRSETMADNEDRMLSICRSIPLTGVHSMTVFQPPFSLTFWREMLGQLPNLRCLRLRDGCLPDLAPVLSFNPRHTGTDNQEEYSDRGQNQVLTPKLEALDLFLIVAAGASLESDDDLVDQPAADEESLYHPLASRKESPGQLTTNGRSFGRWESGHFHFVDSE